MNQVNFLPAKFRQREARRQQRAKHWSLVGVLVFASLAGWVIQSQHTTALAAQAQAVQRQVDSLHNKQLEVNRLDKQRRQLMQRVALQRKLGMAVRESQIITTLSRHMPANIGLNDISMTYQGSASGQRGGANRSHHSGQSVLSIDIQGMAPNDIAIANLVSSLAQDPLFSKVTMRFSRPAAQGHVLGREFGLTMSVNLSRHFITSPKTEEVARAHG